MTVTMSDAIVDSAPSRTRRRPTTAAVRPGRRSGSRHNLFRTPLDGVRDDRVRRDRPSCVLYKTLSFVFVTGRWEIIRVNLRLLMVGRFPPATCCGSPSPSSCSPRGPG